MQGLANMVPLYLFFKTYHQRAESEAAGFCPCWRGTAQVTRPWSRDTPLPESGCPWTLYSSLSVTSTEVLCKDIKRHKLSSWFCIILHLHVHIWEFLKTYLVSFRIWISAGLSSLNRLIFSNNLKERFKKNPNEWSKIILNAIFFWITI